MFTITFHLKNIMGRVSTKSRLLKFGISTDLKCVFCQEIETLEHLYFECSWTHAVWADLLQWLGYHRIPMTWAQEIMWINAESTKKGWRRQFLKATVTEFMYGIWR